MSLESCFNNLSSVKLTENDLNQQLERDRTRLELQRNIILAEPGAFDKKTTESKKIYLLVDARIKIIKLWLKYVKNRNAAETNKNVYPIESAQADTNIRKQGEIIQITIEQFFNSLFSVELTEEHLEKQRDNAEARLDVHENVIKALPGVYNEKEITESKHFYSQIDMELQMIYILLDYVKNKNKGMALNNNHGGSADLRNQQTSATSNNFTPIQNAVLQFLKSVTTTTTDCSVTDICEQFSENQVKQALKFLAGEGHIYSTDDNRYRVVSS